MSETAAPQCPHFLWTSETYTPLAEGAHSLKLADFIPLGILNVVSQSTVGLLQVAVDCCQRAAHQDRYLLVKTDCNLM